MHTDSPESQFRGLRWAAGNILVLLSLTDWSVAGCGVLMLTCEHVNNNVSGLKMSSKRSPSCRVRVSWSFWRKNSHFVTSCWVLSLLCLSLILCFFTIMHFDCVWRPHSFMFIQSFMLLTARLSHHISCERGIIFTPTESPTRLFWAVFLFFSSCDSSSPSGWHCDHGCHTTHAVFSKTAEDSLSHVTTASRLTCYHGDKPTNENSADGCAVDCKLFVLRGDLFFFSLPLPPQHFTATQTQTPLLWHMCTCAQTCIRIKKTWECYSHTCTYMLLNEVCKVVHRRSKGQNAQL